MGWIVNSHGVLGLKEQGFDEKLEAFVAKIVSKFLDHHDPKRARCWIAEMNGQIIGSIFLVKKSATIAQLRLLWVEQKARGLTL